MKKTPIHQRLLAWMLCAAGMIGLLSGCGTPAASTIRLEKILGTVAVENEQNQRLEAREGMQLYSGYRAGTALESLAWIRLDDAKALKLAPSSTAQVLQSGRGLTVRLHQGKLFFNISRPLEADETFTIETATMITGIRGTCGWVEVLDQHTTQVTLLEGEVETLSPDPATGQLRAVTITGGHTITAVYYGAGSSLSEDDDGIAPLIEEGIIDRDQIVYTQEGLRVETLKEEDVPPFVVEEVAQSPALQEKITQATDLSVPLILDTPQPIPTGSAEEAAAPSEDPALSGEAPDPTTNTREPQLQIPSTPEGETDTTLTGPEAAPPVSKVTTYEETVQTTEQVVSYSPDYEIVYVYPRYVTTVYSVTEKDGMIVDRQVVSTSYVDDEDAGSWYRLENGFAYVPNGDGTSSTVTIPGGGTTDPDLILPEGPELTMPTPTEPPTEEAEPEIPQPEETDPVIPDPEEPEPEIPGPEEPEPEEPEPEIPQPEESEPEILQPEETDPVIPEPEEPLPG